MDAELKQRIAQALLERHAELYDVEVPKALEVFFASGAAFNSEGTCAKLSVPGFEPGTFRLVVAPPSWEAAAATDLDDAIVGEDGEWQHAGRFVPVFRVEQGSYIVAKIDDGSCAVGFFNEETFREEGKGWDGGVFLVAESLHAFRGALLLDVDEADYETEVDDEIWEDLTDELEEDEDEDD